jgi:hypothetical protein
MSEAALDAPSTEPVELGISLGLEWDVGEDARCLREGLKTEDGSDIIALLLNDGNPQELCLALCPKS